MNHLLKSSVLENLQQGNPRCSIQTDGDAAAEIRTKVFRIGAPLLRSTIPVSLGRVPAAPNSARDVDGGGRSFEQLGEDEDVETVLSLSDVEFEDVGALS